MRATVYTRAVCMFCILLTGLLVWIPAGKAQAVPGYCTAPNKIDWPAANPVWSLCWVAPSSSDGVDGSGLELRHVFYKGKRVFWQASAPVVNVKYQPGGCGGSTLSYRDWLTNQVAFDANNVISPGYAEPTSPPTTVCDHPGTDAGTFDGVAAEKRPDRLILTAQMGAGWYRYIQKWTFYLDGTIEPTFAFTAVQNGCVSKAHYHNAYWRFDFDIDGFPQDVLDRFLFFIFWAGWDTVGTELSQPRNPFVGYVWRVRDKITGRGYIIAPGAEDGIADAFGVADVWDLAYHGNEIDDGGATGGAMGNAAHMDNYKNNENVDGTDVVFWYRAGHSHNGALTCSTVGPRLTPIGPW